MGKLKIILNQVVDGERRARGCLEQAAEVPLDPRLIRGMHLDVHPLHGVISVVIFEEAAAAPAVHRRRDRGFNYRGRAWRAEHDADPAVSRPEPSASMSDSPPSRPRALGAPPEALICLCQMFTSTPAKGTMSFGKLKTGRIAPNCLSLVLRQFLIRVPLQCCRDLLPAEAADAEGFRS